jgi:hypothetical protein
MARLGDGLEGERALVAALLKLAVDDALSPQARRREEARRFLADREALRLWTDLGGLDLGGVERLIAQVLGPLESPAPTPGDGGATQAPVRRRRGRQDPSPPGLPHARPGLLTQRERHLDQLWLGPYGEMR